jgi:hypothetical protein
MKTLTHQEWLDEALNLFGKDSRGKDWVFECVRCKTKQTGQDFLDLGYDQDKIERVLGFSCIGRFTDKKGCDWTLGGLIPIHQVEVVMPNGHKRPIFEFAKPVLGKEKKVKKVDCPACKGVGMVFIATGDEVSCDACAGTGLVKL